MERPHAALVAAGGIAGATARWAIMHATDSAGWALAGVNAIGGLILGVVVLGAGRGSPTRRLLLGVGFCGAFTTFSTFAVEVAGDLDRGAPGPAALTLFGGLAVGLLATLTGAALGRERS